MPEIATTRAVKLRLLLGACGALLMVGCSSLSQRGPVPGNVFSGRQLSHQGMEAMRRGEWQQAEQLFGAALETSPADEAARRQYAETLWHRGAQADAIREMESAARLSGSSALTFTRLGQMYLALGQIEPAANASAQAMALESESPQVWALQGDLLNARGQASEALASYHRALSYQPNYPDVQLAISDLYAAQNRPQRALATLESLLEQSLPGEEPAEVLYRQGLALKALGRYEDAVDALLLAQSREPKAVDVLCQLGEAQLLAGRPASAQLAAREALALAPDHAGSLDLLHRTRSQQQRLSAALDR